MGLGESLVEVVLVRVTPDEPHQPIIATMLAHGAQAEWLHLYYMVYSG